MRSIPARQSRLAGLSHTCPNPTVQGAGRSSRHRIRCPRVPVPTSAPTGCSGAPCRQRFLCAHPTHRSGLASPRKTVSPHRSGCHQLHRSAGSSLPSSATPRLRRDWHHPRTPHPKARRTLRFRNMFTPPDPLPIRGAPEGSPGSVLRPPRQSPRGRRFAVGRRQTRLPRGGSADSLRRRRLPTRPDRGPGASAASAAPVGGGAHPPRWRLRALRMPCFVREPRGARL